MLVQVIALQVPVGKLCTLSQAPEHLAGSNSSVLHLYRIWDFHSMDYFKDSTWCKGKRLTQSINKFLTLFSRSMGDNKLSL